MAVSQETMSETHEPRLITEPGVSARVAAVAEPVIEQLGYRGYTRGHARLGDEAGLVRLGHDLLAYGHL